MRINERYPGTVFECLNGQILAKANNYMVAGKDEAQRIIKTQRMRDNEDMLGSQIKLYKDKHINVPFILAAVIYESSIMYDVDNSVKSLLDILQYHGAIDNDNLCYRLDVTKCVDRLHPRVVYGIVPIQEKLF